VNIFVLASDPLMAARYHCDKHVVKMCLEYAQILSTVAARYDVKNDDLYRPTHDRHPCTLWAGDSLMNASWLRRLLFHLGHEYELRYGRTHASVSVGLWAFQRVAKRLPVRDQTKFVQAMPDEYRRPNAVSAYRAYYLGEKRRFAEWRRGAPKWWCIQEGVSND